jgi:hypothetical protein
VCLDDVPISIGVIFPLSGSMSNEAVKAKEAAMQFFKTAKPQAEFFLSVLTNYLSISEMRAVRNAKRALLIAPAKLIVFPHGRVSSGGMECTTGQALSNPRRGTISCKSSIELKLDGDPHSSGKELPVHCTDLEREP